MTDLSEDLRGLTRHQLSSWTVSPTCAAGSSGDAGLASSAAVVLAVAVAVPVAAVALNSPRSPRREVVPTDFAAWPDRSPLNDRGPAAGALEEFRRDHGSPVTTDVHWLYRGRIPVAAGKAEYVAIFSGLRAGRPVVVTSTSPADELGANGHETILGADTRVLTFDIFVQDAPDADHVGVYVHDSQQSHRVQPGDPVSTLGPVDDDNVLFALADPTARELRWTQEPLEGAASEGLVGGGTLTSADGVFFGDLGRLDGRVSIDTGHTSTLAVNGSEPALAAVAPVPAPEGYPSQGYEVGQTHGFAGSQLSGGGATLHGDAPPFGRLGRQERTPAPPTTGMVAVNARCTGGGTFDIVLLTSSDRAGGPQAHVRCDGDVHEAFGPHPYVGEYGLQFPADGDEPLQSWGYAFGVTKDEGTPTLSSR